jgi:hypothetical protein
MKSEEQSVIPKLYFEGEPVTRTSFKQTTGREWYKNNPEIEGFDRGIQPTKKLEIHRGEMGLGLHAGEEFNPGDSIVDYIGVPITENEIKKLDPEQHSDVMFPFDARKYSNEGVLINHGVPNATIHAEIVNECIYRVIVIAIHKIEPGEEIFYNYGCGYAFNTLEHVDIPRLVTKCKQLYDDIENVKGDSISSKPVGSYNSSESKLDLESFKPSCPLLKSVQETSLLEYIFTRPLVLYQLRENNEVSYEKLRVLWKHFLFSDSVREFRAECYPWYCIAINCIIMHFNDECFKSLDEMGALFHSSSLKNGPYSYDKFMQIKFNELSKLVKYHAVFKQHQQVFSHLEDSFKSIVDKLVKWMMTGSGQVFFDLNYHSYFDKITDPVMKNDFFLELSETLPILADCLYDKGIKPSPNLKESLDVLIKKIMPENALENLIKMTKSLKCKITTLYQERSRGYKVGGESYRAVLSVKVSSTTLGEISQRAGVHNVAVANRKLEGKDSKVSYKVYFGRG